MASKYDGQVYIETERIAAIQPDAMFDFQRIVAGPLAAFVGIFTASYLRLAASIARRTGIRRFPFIPFTILASGAEVEAAFDNHMVFAVPFGPEMKSLAGPATFALGLDDREHDLQRQVMSTFTRLNLIMTPSALERVAKITSAILEDSGGRIDVVSELFVPVIAETCIRHFGLKCSDPVAFTQWNMAISYKLFGQPTGSSDADLELAAAGSRNLNSCIDASIAAKAAQLSKQGVQRDDTLIGHLLGLRDAHHLLADGTDCFDYLTDDRIRAIVAGMSSGFVPTTVLAAGNLLTAVIARRRRYRSLVEAAKGGNRSSVRDIIMESARFRPAGAPGHFRLVADRFQFVGPRLGRAWFQKGELVLLATGAAMMDPATRRCPHTFMPGLAASPNFMFGHGIHSCLGAGIASEIMTEMFRVLFSKDKLEPTSWLLRRAGPFPWHFRMKFDLSPASCQSMLTVAVPLSAAAATQVEEELRSKFSNPAKRGSPISDALDATGIVQSVSMVVAHLTRKGRPKPTLLIEINADGSADQIYAALEQYAHVALDHILRLAGKPPGEHLATFLERHQVQMRTKPWNDVGLNFQGVGDFSVPQIEQEQLLYAAAMPVVHTMVASHYWRADMSEHTLATVRGMMRGDIIDPARVDPDARPHTEAWEAAERVLQTLRDLEHLLYRPPGRVPRIADHTEQTLSNAIIAYLKRPRQIAVLSSPLWLAIIGAYATVKSGPEFGMPQHGLQVIFAFLGMFAALFVSILVVVFVTLTAVVVSLRLSENADTEDLNLTSPARIAEIEAFEHHPGWIQTQMTSVNTLKAGRMRIAALAFGLATIGWQVRHWFRSGFVVDIGTIRNAKWFRIKGTDQLIFQATFDGSWEAYLEDFANKAFQGQNAVWSNCEGFPKTRYLSLDGARNADRFKRWVRGKQIVTPFWYCRFPGMSNAQIRVNALVRDGLAKARTQSEAQAWMSYFGSRPRPGKALETENIQSLVLNGQKDLKYSACIALRFKGTRHDPELIAKRRRFVGAIAGKIDPRVFKDHSQGSIETVGFPTIGFGDVIHQNEALFVAFSHEGLAQLGLKSSRRNLELDSFSAAFVCGMGARAGILGDEGKNAPERWDWYDRRADDSDASRTDLLLFPMASSKSELALIVSALRSVWTDCAVHVATIETGLVPDGEKTQSARQHVSQPLGFRDGFSQPVMRGTFRYSLPSAWHDKVEPGEFVLGYRDNRQMFPPSPSIAASRDPGAELPDMPEKMPADFAAFGEGDDTVRDLGRNGTYIAVRQIELDEAGFERQLETRAAAMGAPITKHLLAAKVIGRWRSGAPLVRYPDRDDPNYDPDEESGFLYGEEDPQGTRCPFGAHIRRANPRDSFGPDSRVEIEITNRHRILRRGRSYRGVTVRDNRFQTADVSGEGHETANLPGDGLLFVAMNANIERQFEFVQQTWINSTSFHGLREEPDPLLYPGKVGNFTMPTANGPLAMSGLSTFARVRGGGYFFMPGKALLRFLGDHSSIVPRIKVETTIRRA